MKKVNRKKTKILLKKRSKRIQNKVSSDTILESSSNNSINENNIIENFLKKNDEDISLFSSIKSIPCNLNIKDDTKIVDETVNSTEQDTILISDKLNKENNKLANDNELNKKNKQNNNSITDREQFSEEYFDNEFLESTGTKILTLENIPNIKKYKTFHDLKISPWQIDTLNNQNMYNPTDIQKACIPYILEGNNIVGLAKTGSGKTATFAIPILMNLSKDLYGIFALILTPTHELAKQIQEQFEVLGVYMNIKVSTVIGGSNYLLQKQELEQQPHILIATPGRLSCILDSDKKILSPLRNIKYLVLDEADRLLDVNMISCIENIVKYIPNINTMQTLLFTATLKPSLLLSCIDKIDNKELISSPIRLIKPLIVKIFQDNTNFVNTLDQRYLYIPKISKDIYLTTLLQITKKNNPEYDHNRLIIIFVSKCHTAIVLKSLFDIQNISCTSLHSKLDTKTRIKSLQEFRDNNVKVLIATDLAARGLDIPFVQIVINYDIPTTIDQYIHRVGRTARANRSGLCINFITQDDIKTIKYLEKNLNIHLKEYTEQDEGKVKENIKPVFEAKKDININFYADKLDKRILKNGIIIDSFKNKKRKIFT